MPEPRHAFFATADGPRVEYLDYPPAGAESGPPVVCLHGLTRNMRDFDDLAPMIAALGRRVIVPSQRGRGGSDADPTPARYHPGTYAGDMLGLLASLSIPRAVFVGTSMGGLISMVCAALAPATVAGIVLNDVGPEIDPVGLARIRSYVGKSTPAASWAEAAERSRAINGSAFPKETGDAFWLKAARATFREVAPGRLELAYDPAISQPINAAPPGPPADAWPLFAGLATIPTLIIRGELSDILMLSTIEEMRRRKPDLRVATVPDVGHAPFLVEPAAWAALRGFIQSVQ